MQSHDGSIKQQSILTTVAAQLATVCSCSISTRYMADTRMTCGEGTTDRVSIEGALVAVNNTDEQKLHQFLQDWVDTSPAMEVTGVSLQIIKCSTYSWGKDSCTFREDTSAPTTSQTPAQPKIEVATLKSSNGGSLSVIIYAGIGVGVVVVFGIACILAIAIWRRKNKNRTYKTNR